MLVNRLSRVALSSTGRVSTSTSLATLSRRSVLSRSTSLPTSTRLFSTTNASQTGRNRIKQEFQAETRKILEIVARSLYTDKEVFVRELVSNSSDALQKLRLKQMVGEVPSDSKPLEINIIADPKAKQLIIQDNGIGMTKEELIKNLGNIGHSGSKEFLNNLKAENKSGAEIIGQFGVGFYSCFMVSKNVTVFSKSSIPGSPGYMWSSDGSGSYEIEEVDDVERGTKIVLDLTEKDVEFSQKEAIEKIIKKYSNFVGFPIKVNGKQVNTVKALWLMAKNEISEKDHREFYQLIAHAFDDPQFILHYSTDSPIDIRALLYIGQQHGEKFGMGRIEPGLSLYCRKVLIQSKAKLVPDWLRFIRGVVDSEDIPLNISREHLQDSQLVQRIGNVITKRIIRWLDEESKKDQKKYNQFFEEFGNFIKEGVCSDFSNKDDIAKLLRFETSAFPPGELTSLEDYIERSPSDQKEIYFLVAPTRAIAETSPYYEGFKSQNKEVIFCYSSIDDFVMNAIVEYKKKKLVSIESGAVTPSTSDKKEEMADTVKSSGLTDAEMKDLGQWIKDTLNTKVSGVKASQRLVDSPAIIVDHESAAFRRMMKYVDPQRAPQLPKQVLEVNPKHEIIVSLNSVRSSNPELAKLIAEQIFDDALVSAGLLEDARSMLPRINKLLSQLLTK